MAQGRTTSSSFLTELDDKVLSLCKEISDLIVSLISDLKLKAEFKDKYGKISKTRDAGVGRGGGKLQRDALCTRGIVAKGPFSNRNLRWHPLIIAKKPIYNVKEIERIEINGDIGTETLNFIVNINGIEKSFPSEKVHELPETFLTLPKHWADHLNLVSNWDNTQWTQNSCLITAFEACNWQDAVESYAVLALSVAIDNYNLSPESVTEEIKKILQSQTIDKNVILPSDKFPNDIDNIINCPLCLVRKSDKAAMIEDRVRDDRFSFSFSGNKRNEGDDNSTQIMHIEPLIEGEFRHNAKNVRFGHRWCNVAMTDHSINETLNFMKYIVDAHDKNS